MKKFATAGLVLLCFSMQIHAWDEERDIESEIYLPGISKNVLNFRLVDPLHVAEDFYIGLGFALSYNWKISVIGEFENQATQAVSELSREYHANGDGSLGGMSRETKENSFTAGPIKNILHAYVGYVVGDKASFGFSFGSGLDYGRWETIEMKYDHHFTTAGLIDILNPGVDDRRLTSKRFAGEIPIKLGFGFSFLNQPFVNRTDDILDSQEWLYSVGRLNSSHKLHVGILGAGGAPAGLPVLNASGISLAAFDGAGDQYNSETIFVQDNSNLQKSYSVAHNESFSWVKLRYDGMVETEIDLDKWAISAFQSWYRLRFIPEFDAWFEMKLYGQTMDQSATYYYDSSFGPAWDNGDYQIRTTVYGMAPEFDFGVQLPFELDFRPTKVVQVRLQYIPKLGFHLLNYTAQYSESTLKNGSNVSFEDPVLTGSFFRMDHAHTAGVRFRFEPFPEFRLTLNGTWTLATYSENYQLSAKDNIRKTAGGGQIAGPYTQIPASNKSEGAWTQTVETAMVFDWALIPNQATLTMTWSPSLTIAGPVDSSVLNLSNWKIQAVVRYDGKDARAANGFPGQAEPESPESDWEAIYGPEIPTTNP